MKKACLPRPAKVLFAEKGGGLRADRDQDFRAGSLRVGHCHNRLCGNSCATALQPRPGAVHAHPTRERKFKAIV